MYGIQIKSIIHLALLCAAISLSWCGSDYAPADSYGDSYSYEYPLVRFIHLFQIHKILIYFSFFNIFEWKKQIVNYEYAIDDYYGNKHSKKETIDGDTAVGEYKTLLPDGKQQVVTYESGPYGHQANVNYEEGGYMAPAETYAPAPSYTPAPSYETPAPSYETPAPSYETPAPSYEPAYVEPPYEKVSDTWHNKNLFLNICFGRKLGQSELRIRRRWLLR